MKYAFHPEARDEFLDAISYLESQEPGLGYHFALEIHDTIERAARQPHMWPVIFEDVRRCLAHRFPDGVLFHFEDGAREILIVGVMHLHRDPDYWKNRSKNP